MKGKAIIGVVALAAYLFTAAAPAQVFEPREFEDPERAQRYRVLISELRCLVCQNQNLADSNAPLAADLRQLTYDMIAEGKSDREIIDFMVARYGDFVLYRPPLKPTTALLWAGPFALLATGLWLLLSYVRRRHGAAPADGSALSPEERARLERLVSADEEPGPGKR